MISDFYSIFIVSVNNLATKEFVSPQKRYLGDDLEGNALYAYVGKYGPVIQIGDKNIKYSKIEPQYNVETITLEDYLNMAKFPKKLGTYLDKDVYIKTGTYGFYISFNENNYKILENLDSNLTLEEAITCIKGSTKIDKFTIKDGPYGPYIIYNSKFYSIPKNYDIPKLTKKDCEEIIKLPKKKLMH